MKDIARIMPPSLSTARRSQQAGDLRTEHVLERAGMNRMMRPWIDHDHVARDGRLLEGEIGTALIERAEQRSADEDDAERMRTPQSARPRCRRNHNRR